MRILIVKTSSMGDVIHTLPAVTDAARVFPDARFDWLVEDTFAEIPAWHPAVDRVIPVALRRWRRQPWQFFVRNEWRGFLHELRTRRYDLVIDAQGLIKSALLTRFVNAPVVGFARHSVREPLATLAYRTQVNVPYEMHAVERTRHLFAKSLDYPCPADLGDYGLRVFADPKQIRTVQQVVLVHATTRSEKHWPEEHWQQLCWDLSESGFAVRLPWATTVDRERAERIARSHQQASVLPRLSLNELAVELLATQAVVAVDTGLGHLAAALDVPALSLYGCTSPGRVGTYGTNQRHLCATDHADKNSSNRSAYLGHLTSDMVQRVLFNEILRRAA